MMKLVTIHDLKVGNEYYLLSEDNHSIVIDYEHLKSFHKVEYRGTMKIREMRGGIIHVNHSFEFINLITNSIVHMQDYDIEQRIFVDIHDILNYLVMRLDKLNENRDPHERPLYRFDDFIIEIVKMSQEEFPEKWI